MTAKETSGDPHLRWLWSALLAHSKDEWNLAEARGSSYLSARNHPGASSIPQKKAWPSRTNVVICGHMISAIKPLAQARQRVLVQRQAAEEPSAASGSSGVPSSR